VKFNCLQQIRYKKKIEQNIAIQLQYVNCKDQKLGVAPLLSQAPGLRHFYRILQAFASHEPTSNMSATLGTAASGLELPNT